MGANLYGVANTPPLLNSYSAIGNTNITCPPGVETNIIQSTNIISADRGFYEIVGWVTVCVGVGATSPTQLNIACRINNGADLAIMQVNQSLLVPGAFPEVSWQVAVIPPQGAFYPPGSVIQISLFPTGQQVIVTGYCTQGVLGIYRLPP